MKKTDRSYHLRLGSHVKTLMAKHGKTAEDVAAHGRLETKQVYRIINGENSPTVRVLRAVAIGIGVHIADLFAFEQDDN